MKLIVGDWASLGQQATIIRLEVFVREQGVPLVDEFDDYDVVAVHALVLDADDVAAGTGRLLPDAHIGRMAVRAQYRSQGVGSQVLQALIDEARRRAYPHVVLSAQVHACPFYEAHGFVAEGESYMDVGILHRVMRLSF